MFGDERNVQAILEFLEGTKVGKMPSRVLLAGARLGRGGWARPSPLDCILSYVLSLARLITFLAPWGEGVQGHLTITAQAGSRQEKVNLEKPVAAPLRRAAAQPLPWPFGPHVAGYK